MIYIIKNNNHNKEVKKIIIPFKEGKGFNL